jgi:hypothetical protein
MNSKDFKRLNRWLYQLPELLPERDIHKFENIWVEKYGHRISTRALALSDVDMKQLLKMDLKDVLKKRRKR